MTSLLLLLLAAEPPPEPALTFDVFLADVVQHSPTLRTQRATLSAADAQLALSRVFPEPVIAGGLASLDVSFVGAQNNVAASVSEAIEWPGKRSARIAATGAAREVAMADLEDAARVVRSTAALAWIDAVSAQRIAARQRAALETLQQVVALNERRLAEGAGSELAVLQSRVEARRLEGDVASAEAQARSLELSLLVLAGRAASAEGLPTLSLELTEGREVVDPQHLTQVALEGRRDVAARRKAVEAAQKQVDLARSAAVPDVTVGLGWLYYTEGQPGSAYQGPPYHTVSATLSMPLPVTGRVSAELQSARAQLESAESQRDALELQVRAEVEAAVIRAQAARARLALFDDAVLRDGDRLLAMAKTSYLEGRAQLFELLSAQRSWSELQVAAEAARAEQARAVVTLETAVARP